jgi:hypothetical protein
VIGAVLLSLLALSGPEARAAPLTVRLTYGAGPRCPEAADFQAVVVARLGYDPFVESAPVHVLVRVEPRTGTEAGTIDGHIEWRDATGTWAGEQTFPSVSTDCARLVRTMGFALAVHLQLLAKMTSAPDAPAPAPAEAESSPEAPSATVAKQPLVATPSSREPTVTSATAVEPSPTRGPGPALALGTGPAVGFGMSSEPVLLGRLFGVVEWQRASLELAAVASLPTTTRRPDGAGFWQQHLLGSAAACAVAGRAAATQWNGCVVGAAGMIRMAGDHIDRPTSARVLLVEAGVRAGLRQELGRRAFVSAHADGLVNLTRWTATLDQVQVWTAPRFAGTLGIEVGVLFP